MKCRYHGGAVVRQGGSPPQGVAEVVIVPVQREHGIALGSLDRGAIAALDSVESQGRRLRGHFGEKRFAPVLDEMAAQPSALALHGVEGGDSPAVKGSE